MYGFYNNDFFKILFEALKIIYKHLVCGVLNWLEVPCQFYFKFFNISRSVQDNNYYKILENLFALDLKTTFNEFSSSIRACKLFEKAINRKLFFNWKNCH